MENELLQQRIEAYIKAYNNFDVDGMLSTLHPEIEFKNITSGEVTLTIKGLEAFKAQAEQAISLFTQRKQTITCISFDNQQAEVQIDYQGILAVDLPNGLKAGNTLELKGKSVFLFEDNLICYIEDIS
jgi:hypothetical protein